MDRMKGGMMAAKHTGLGRGLDALIDEAPVATGRRPSLVPVGAIRANPRQPRRTLRAEGMSELVASVAERGILQPLLVRRVEQGYELIAGERRWTAARQAGLSEVPVTVVDADDRASLELALVENLQREDLNLIEEAEGYRSLCETFGLTQEEAARRVGRARATVANALRVLRLPDEVRNLVGEGALSAGHAKVLLGVENPEDMKKLALQVVQNGWSVRELERKAASLRRRPRKPRACREDMPRSHLEHLTGRLQHYLGTAVRLAPSGTLANGKKRPGHLEIDYYSNEDLDRILAQIGYEEDT